MKVTMTSGIGGFRNGEPWPPIGGVIDVPAHEAAGLIHAGYAEKGDTRDADTTEQPDAKTGDEPNPDAAGDTDETGAPAADVAEASSRQLNKLIDEHGLEVSKRLKVAEKRAAVAAALTA